jgi:hypothetical protein
MDKRTETVLNLSGMLVSALQEHVVTLKELQAATKQALERAEADNESLVKKNVALDCNNDILISLLEDKEDDDKDDNNPFLKGRDND